MYQHLHITSDFIGDVHRKPHAKPNPDPDADGDSHRDAQRHGKPQCNWIGDINYNRDGEPKSLIDAQWESNGDPKSDGNINGKPHGNANADRIADLDPIPVPNSDCNVEPNIELDAEPIINALCIFDEQPHALADVLFHRITHVITDGISLDNPKPNGLCIAISDQYRDLHTTANVIDHVHSQSHRKSKHNIKSDGNSHTHANGIRKSLHDAIGNPLRHFYLQPESLDDTQLNQQPEPIANTHSKPDAHTNHISNAIPVTNANGLLECNANEKHNDHVNHHGISVAITILYQHRYAILHFIPNAITNSIPNGIWYPDTNPDSLCVAISVLQWDSYATPHGIGHLHNKPYTKRNRDPNSDLNTNSHPNSHTQSISDVIPDVHPDRYPE